MSELVEIVHLVSSEVKHRLGIVEFAIEVKSNDALVALQSFLPKVRNIAIIALQLRLQFSIGGFGNHGVYITE
jgi:hypothetical protein